MKHKKEYLRLHRTVNDRAFDLRTSTVLADFGKYFDEFPDCTKIPVDAEFGTWFTVAHRTVKQEDMAVFRQMFKQVAQEPTDEVKTALVGSLLEANVAVLVSDIAERYTRGDEVSLAKALRRIVDEYEADVERKVKIPFVDIGDNLFKDAVNNTGLTWRLDALNLSMRPLRVGDFGILAARPDAGKTSFIADAITFMACQIPANFDNANRPIIWFNNEGPGERIQERIIQAALGLPASKLVKLQKAGRLWTDYTAAIGGDLLRIRVLDVHGYKSWQIEEIIKQTNPALVVFDMIDNIKFDGDVLNGGQRTDQVLEGMYQWARELAVRFKLIALATSQISADGDGLAYPTLGMLKDSKTGKQGAADFIITLGKKNEAAYENIRFIGLTKNKLHVEGQKRSPATEVIFAATEGRFYSIKESKVSVDINDGRGDDDKVELPTQGEPVRSPELGGVDGGKGSEGGSGLPADLSPGADQGVAGEDALALLT
ncbi:DnaB-like replicative helicase [Pseudomonas phage vB_PpuP-Konnatiik]